MINSRKIEDLAPEARAVCERHIALCEAAGIKLLVTSTYRDYVSQDYLYAIGRTIDLDKPRVTKARAGRSWHNFACAWDVVPLDADGKPVWDDQDPVWDQVVTLGIQAGAEAGATWKTFPDLPHFQLKPLNLTLAQAKTRFDVSGTIFGA